MKYIILLGDGMADYPVGSLGGKTPLEYSHTPNMDNMASRGTIGMVDTIPAGLSPGSDVANLAVLGYDARQCYTGRGPLEAANMGVGVGPTDVAFRCNLVTLTNDNTPKMEDFTAGHIDSASAKELVNALDGKLGTNVFSFHPGVSYRHLLLWKNGVDKIETVPPHDISGKEIRDYLPKGHDAEQLKDLMHEAEDILIDHPINRTRIQNGKKPANSIWLWGQGRAPIIPPITELYNIKGGMISAVDLLNGIGKYAGLKVIHVEGATGYIDTNYQGKARKALDALNELDFIFLHVEAPDEMGHEGNLEGKIRAIEDFDKKIVGSILAELPKFGEYRLIVLSDHPTPVSLRTHSSEPSPFAVYSSNPSENIGLGYLFGETSARRSGLLISPGYELMNLLINQWRQFIAEKSH